MPYPAAPTLMVWLLPVVHLSASSCACNHPDTCRAALAMKFFFDRYNFESGGALGSLTLGLAVKELWASGQPRWLAHQDSGSDFTRSVSRLLCVHWCSWCSCCCAASTTACHCAACHCASVLVRAVTRAYVGVRLRSVWAFFGIAEGAAPLALHTRAAHLICASMSSTCVLLPFACGHRQPQQG